MAIKTSIAYLELDNLSSNPTDLKSTKYGIAFISGTFKKWNGSSWAALTGGSGATTWDELYDLDQALTIDSTSLTFSLTHATNNGLTLSASAGAAGDVLQFSNAGSGKDIAGTSDTWSISKAGAMLVKTIAHPTTNTDITLDANGSGKVTIAGTSTGNIELQRNVTMPASKSLTMTGVGGSNIFVMTAGDVSIADGSVTQVDADNATSFSLTNNTITTAGLIAVTSTSLTTGNGLLMTCNGLTEGAMVNLVTTAAGLTTGAFITANDGTERFSVKADGATQINSGVNSTKALEVVGIQTSENVVTLTSSGVTADDKAIVLINSSGNSASGSNQIRIAPSGTPVEGSIGIEFVGASKTMQAMYIDGDSVDNSVAVFNGGGALAANKAIVEIVADGTPAANTAAGLRIDITGVTATNNPYAARFLSNGKDAGGLYIDSDAATLSAVLINGGGAVASGKGVLQVTADGTPASGGNIVDFRFTGTATNSPSILNLYGTGKAVKAIVADVDNTTIHAVGVTGSGALNAGRMLYVANDGTPAAATDFIAELAFTGTATNTPGILKLMGDTKNVNAITVDTDNVGVHSVSISGAGALASGNMLYVTNAGTPAANTDAVAQLTFTGTATNNPIVANVNNGTADALPLYVNSNVASATREVAQFVQDSATGANECVLLKQDDIDQAFIEFTTTVGVGNGIEAVGAKSLTTTHFIKVNITGVGAVYLPVGTIA